MLLTMAVLAALLFFGVRPLVLRFARSVLDDKLTELSDIIGHEVSIGEMPSGLTEDIVLERIVVRSGGDERTVLDVPKVRLDFSVWDALMGRRMPRLIEVDGFRATLLIENGHLPDLDGLDHGMRGYGGRESDGAGTIEDVRRGWRVIGTGEVVLVAPGQTGPTASFNHLSVDVMQYGAGQGEARISGRAHRLSEGAASISCTARWGGGRGLRVHASSDRPLDPAPLLGDIASWPFSLTGMTLEVDPAAGTAAVALDGIEVPETGMFIERMPAFGSVMEGGAFTARKARVVVRTEDSGEGLPIGLAAPLMFNIESIAVWDAKYSWTMTGSDMGTLGVRGLNASISGEASSGGVQVNADGDFGGSGMGWSRFEAKALFDVDWTLREANVSAVGPSLVGVASRFHPRLLPWPGAEMGLNLAIKGDGRRYRTVGHLSTRDLTYFWTKLCLVPITGLDIGADFTLMLDLTEEELNLTVDPIAVGEARFAFELDVRGFSSKPKVIAGFSIPKQRCEDVAAAIPPVMLPRLEGARFDGWMSLEIGTRVDFNNLEAARLKVNADMDECRVLSLGPLVNVFKLERPFVHVIHEEDLDEPIRVGPATSSYVPLEEIPVPVQQAALATEDMRFFEHDGFKVSLMRRALWLNLERGWYVYGGSTISQQLVKNLFLSREKTLSRKLEEAIIVWVMEETLEKERILELYLNCIEFGRHIYGIRAAALEYYDKDPIELTPMDGAFIMATKPNPRYAHKVYRQRSFNDWWVKRMKGILERLYDPMEVIGRRPTVTPDPCPPDGQRGRYLVPCFYYSEEDLYTQPTVSPDTEIPPGMPEELPKDDGGEEESGL